MRVHLTTMIQMEMRYNDAIDVACYRTFWNDVREVREAAFILECANKYNLMHLYKIKNCLYLIAHMHTAIQHDILSSD